MSKRNRDYNTLIRLIIIGTGSLKTRRFSTMHNVLLATALRHCDITE